jgi:hypothetical protein
MTVSGALVAMAMAGSPEAAVRKAKVMDVRGTRSTVLHQSVEDGMETDEPAEGDTAGQESREKTLCESGHHAFIALNNDVVPDLDACVQV